MAECTCANPQAVAQAINDQKKDLKEQIKDSSEYLDQTLRGQKLKIQTETGSKDVDNGHGNMTPFQLCHWNAPEYGIKGTFDWTTLFRVAGLAIAVANGIAQSEIADKQQDLADKWYSQAKFKWDRFAGRYMPLEIKLLNEVSSVPIRNIDCAGAHDRAEASVNTAYASTAIYMKQQAKKLCLCLDPSLLSAVNQKQNMMLVDTENFNLTDERWFTDYKNDQRWNRRSNVLNLGRNLNSESMQYGKIANALYGQIGQQLDRAAGGLMQAVGYYGARNDTYYSTTYLNTNQLTDPASGTILAGGGKGQ